MALVRLDSGSSLTRFLICLAMSMTRSARHRSCTSTELVCVGRDSGLTNVTVLSRSEIGTTQGVVPGWVLKLNVAPNVVRLRVVERER